MNHGHKPHINWLNPWRLALWSVALGLLLLPLIAMQFTEEVNWTAFDFVVAAILLGTTALLIDLGCCYSVNLTGRAGWMVMILTSFLLIWINLAVGIIGSENNPANLLYVVVLLSAVLGGLVVRFKPRAMSKVLLLTAMLQIAAELVIRLSGWGAAPVINITFALLWLLAAGLLYNSHTTNRVTEA